MDHYIIFLRLIHIGFGVFWGGVVIFMPIFLLPTVKALGPEGGKFMQTLMKTKNFLVWINISAALTIVSGLALYERDSGGFGMSWIHSGMGTMITIGAVAAFAGWVIANIMQKPAATKMMKIGKTIAEAGGPPSTEQQQEIGKQQAKLFMGAQLTAWLIGVSVLTMAIARYVRW